MKTFVFCIIVCIGCTSAIIVKNERRIIVHKHPNENERRIIVHKQPNENERRIIVHQQPNEHERRVIIHKQPIERNFVAKLFGFENQEPPRKPPPPHHKYSHKKPLKQLPVFPHHYENHEHHHQTESVKLHGDSPTQKYAIIKKIPYQVKVPVPRPVPVKIPVPKPYTIEKRIPVPVKVYVPHPYTVEKKVPYPVKVQVPVPQPYIVERKVPFEVKVPVEKPYIVHVPKPYPVYFDEHAPEMHAHGHYEHHKDIHSSGHKEHSSHGDYKGYEHKEHHYGDHKEHHYGHDHKEHHYGDHKEHHYPHEHKDHHYGDHKEHKGYLETTPNFSNEFKFVDHEWKLSQDHANNYFFEKKPSHNDGKIVYMIPKKEGGYASSEEWNKPAYHESKPVYPTLEDYKQINQEEWNKPTFSAPQDWPKHESSFKFEDSDTFKIGDSVWSKPQDISFEHAISKSGSSEEAHPSEDTTRDGKALQEQIAISHQFESLPQPEKLVLVDPTKSEGNSKAQDADIIYGGGTNEHKGNFKPPTDVFYINPSKDGNVVGSSYNIGSSSDVGSIGSIYKTGSSFDANTGGVTYNFGSGNTGSPEGRMVGASYNVKDSTDSKQGGDGIKPIQEYPIYVSNISNGKEAKSVEANFERQQMNRSPKMLAMSSTPENNQNNYVTYNQNQNDMPASGSQNYPSVAYSDMTGTGSELVPIYFSRYNEMVPSLNRRYDYVEQPLVKTRKTPAHREERSMRRMDFEPQVWARPNMIGWIPIENRRYDTPPPGDERS